MVIIGNNGNNVVINVVLMVRMVVPMVRIGKNSGENYFYQTHRGNNGNNNLTIHSFICVSQTAIQYVSTPHINHASMYTSFCASPESIHYVCQLLSIMPINDW